MCAGTLALPGALAAPDDAVGARLDALDLQHQRALRGTVFANADGPFAFHASAEDARYQVGELGPEVEEEDPRAAG